jgi:hypothetical protein
MSHHILNGLVELTWNEYRGRGVVFISSSNQELYVVGYFLLIEVDTIT